MMSANIGCFSSQECKRRKVKCSGENPCAGCQQVQTVCLYERSTRFRTARRSSMVSSRSKDESATGALSSTATAPRLDDASQTSATDQPANLEADFSPQHVRHGSSDYYFNLAQQLLVGSSPIYGHASSSGAPRVPRLAQDLQKLILNRSSRKPTPLLSIIPVPRWLEILDMYEEEIGLLYPFQSGR